MDNLHTWKNSTNQNGSNWRTNFYRLLVGQGFAGVFSAVVSYSLLYYLTLTSHSPIILSLADILGFLPMALLSPFAGPWIDRLNKKILMIGADVIVGITAVGLFIHGGGGKLEYWAVFIAIFIRSLAMTVQQPTLQSVVPTIVPENQLLNANGRFGILQAMNMTAPPVIGAALYAAVPISAIMLLNVAAALIGALTVGFTRIPRTKRSGQQTSIIADFKEGWRALKNKTGILDLTIASAFATFAFMPAVSMFPLMTTDYFHGSLMQVTLIDLVWGLGMISGGILVGRFANNTQHRLLPVAIAAAVLALVFLVSGLLPRNLTGYIIFTVINAFGGVFLPIMNAPIQTLLQSSFDQSILGRVIGLTTTLNTLPGPLGLAFAGPLAEMIGVNGLFVASGVAVLLIILAAMRVKAIRRINRENFDIVKNERGLAE
ncbi:MULTISPECIES: MFS transporter [unclassified Sporolactobacillus]|uniref:MFS transporter n=1 Tax=unclassified Sporolactobacillus TaxID=2628533 RepID=UPI00236883C0|nr:MFS transporter [Sporolactobacillus sp. CQH2019]MDD9149661.1 MFS transporter [Sporolactobacillus sp. CQH2019]